MHFGWDDLDDDFDLDLDERDEGRIVRIFWLCVLAFEVLRQRNRSSGSSRSWANRLLRWSLLLLERVSFDVQSPPEDACGPPLWRHHLLNRWLPIARLFLPSCGRPVFGCSSDSFSIGSVSGRHDSYVEVRCFVTFMDLSCNPRSGRQICSGEEPGFRGLPS